MMSLIEIVIALFEPVINLVDKVFDSKKNPRLAISLDIPNCVFSNIPEGISDRQPHSAPFAPNELNWGRSITWTIKMTIKNNSSVPAYNIKWGKPCQRGVIPPQLPQQFSLSGNKEKVFNLHVEHFAEMSTDEMRQKLRCNVMPYFLDHIYLWLSYEKESGRKVYLVHITSKDSNEINVLGHNIGCCKRRYKRLLKDVG